MKHFPKIIYISLSLANIILYDCQNELGDINQDGETNILDIMAIVNRILSN